MRGIGLSGLVLVWVGVGCPSVDPYACTSAAQCVRNGVDGSCDPSTSRCAFPDLDCPSGLRYPPGTSDGLSEECAQPQSAPTGSSTSTSTSTTTTSSESSTTNAPSESGERSSSSEGESTADTCRLLPAAPDSWSDSSNLEVAEAIITARGVPAVRIENSPGAIIRDLEIDFGGSAGVVISDSPGVTIERIRIVNGNAPESGHASLSEVGILVQRSDGAVIRDIFIEDARSGVVVVDSDDLTLERIWVNDVRGEVTSDGMGTDEGGDCILLQTCARVEVTGVGCTNEPNGFEPHAGVFIDRCTDVVLEEGIAENIDQFRGAGVRVHTLGDMSERITVRDFDVVGGTHACYDTHGGLDVTFENAGCRNQPGSGWVVSQFAGGPLRVIGGRHYNVGRLECCVTSDFTEFDVAEDQFVPRLPPAVRAPCDL